MKQPSIKEVKDFVLGLWYDASSYYKEPDVEVRKENDVYFVTVTRMYDAPGLSFSHLKALSEYFGTDNILTDEDIHSSGCDTCDYGSRYGFTLRIQP